jgi:hypothetical protein
MRSNRVCVVAILLASVTGSAAELSTEEVRKCMRRNLPERTARQELSFVSRDATGAQRSLDAEFFWKRGAQGLSKVLGRVSAPPDLRGSAFLLIERDGSNEMFSYVPELKRVRRISGRQVSGSLFGTDFSYEDVERLQAMASQTDVERLPDSEVAGRKTFVLSAALPPDPTSTYTRVVSYVDEQTCVALRTELSNKEGVVAKEVVIPFEQVEAEGERFVPRAVIARNLDAGSETRLRVEKIEYDVPLSDSFFSEAALTKGH